MARGKRALFANFFVFHDFFCIFLRKIRSGKPRSGAHRRPERRPEGLGVGKIVVLQRGCGKSTGRRTGGILPGRWEIRRPPEKFGAWAGGNTRREDRGGCGEGSEHDPQRGALQAAWRGGRESVPCGKRHGAGKGVAAAGGTLVKAAFSACRPCGKTEPHFGRTCTVSLAWP